MTATHSKVLDWIAMEALRLSVNSHTEWNRAVVIRCGQDWSRMHDPRHYTKGTDDLVVEIPSWMLLLANIERRGCEVTAWCLRRLLREAGVTV